jgi:hypothetical protein
VHVSAVPSHVDAVSIAALHAVQAVVAAFAAQAPLPLHWFAHG